jgi:putative PIG3 family NAD(P)H quinone oxidoreductase
MSNPATMQALTIDGNRLRATTLPVPSIAPDEVLIRVAYVGVNRADAMQLAGTYAPPQGASPLLGLEVSGWVAALGAKVQGFAVGQEVCALLSGGGYAAYVAAPATQILPLPHGTDLRTAAALPEAAATSIMALIAEGALKAGERVLLHGGTSGVGLLMGQIAMRYGATVFATVGSAEKAEFVKQRGMHPLRYRERPFHEALMEATANEGVDLVIDTLGAPQLANHLRVLRKGGRMVTLAMLEGSTIAADTKMTRLMMNHLRWSGATLRSRSAAEKADYMRIVAERVWPAVADGTITPVVDSVFPLAEAEKALARMQERLHMGKILLEVTPE